MDLLKEGLHTRRIVSTVWPISDIYKHSKNGVEKLESWKSSSPSSGLFIWRACTGKKELTLITIWQAFSRLGGLNSRTQLSFLLSTHPMKRKLIEPGLKIPTWAYLEETFGCLDCSKQQLIVKRLIL